MTGVPRMRRLMLAAVLLVAGIVVGPAGPASAAPGDEGGTPTLREVLESASRGYLEAKNALDNSRRRQTELNQQMEAAEKRLAVLSVGVGDVAVAQYRMPGVGTPLALLNSDSPDTLFARMLTLNMFNTRLDQQLGEYKNLRRQLREGKAAIDGEVVRQQEHLTVMTKKKQAAERALATVGGAPTGGYRSR